MIVMFADNVITVVIVPIPLKTNLDSEATSLLSCAVNPLSVFA